jgi:hypothetical protein
MVAPLSCLPPAYTAHGKAQIFPASIFLQDADNSFVPKLKTDCIGKFALSKRLTVI